MANYSRREKVKLEISKKTVEKEKFHQDIELIYILDGTMNIIVSGKKTTLNSDDILLINSNKPYSFRASDDILFVKISILYELFGDIINERNVMFWCDSTKENSAKYDKIRRTIRLLISNYYENKNSTISFRHISLSYRIMDLLSREFVFKKRETKVSKKKAVDERIMKINDYIRGNYSHPISIKDLADQLYLSVGYLSRFFKQNFGMNFTDYVTRIRLFNAVDELLYTELPITVVAYDNGFPSVVAFNKAFKDEYKETPSAFRKRTAGNQIKQDMEQKIEEERIKAILRQADKNSAVRESQAYQAEQIIWKNPSECETLKAFWNKAINIGTAEDLLRSEVREHVMLLRQALHFEYVRFWNPLSKGMLIDLDSNDTSYNFSRIDSVLDFILEQRMKPHIELGRKPKRIQTNTEHSLLMENSVTSQYTDQWMEAFDAFMHHISRRYGIDEINEWRVEVWDDNIRVEQIQSKENIELYIEKFQNIFQIVRKYTKELKIGGNGTHPDKDAIKHIAHVWKAVKANGFQPDYVSFMSYPYISELMPNGIYSRRSSDREYTLMRMKELQSSWVKQDVMGINVYLTEWNFTVSDRNYMNDTCFKAAYTMQNYIDLYGVVDEVDYFYGTDRVTEYYDSNELLYGGCGLLTRDGIMKPVAFAFDFLNCLKPYYISKGKNYLATIDKNGDFAIVCHNCSDLSYNYFQTDEDKLDRQKMYKYYDNEKQLNLKFQFGNLKDGVYQVKRKQINENYGSVFHLWEKMEFEKELSRDDIKYFRRICEPSLFMQKVEIKNGKATIDVELAPNEICLIRVKYKS